MFLVHFLIIIKWAWVFFPKTCNLKPLPVTWQKILALRSNFIWQKNWPGQISFNTFWNVRFSGKSFHFNNSFLDLKKAHLFYTRINSREKYSYSKFFYFTTKYGDVKVGLYIPLHGNIPVRGNAICILYISSERVGTFKF